MLLTMECSSIESMLRTVSLKAKKDFLFLLFVNRLCSRRRVYKYLVVITVAFFPLCGESVLSYPSGRMPSRVREEEEEEEEEAAAEENLIRYSIAEMLARWSSG